MANQKEVEKTVDEIIKMSSKIGGWIESEKKVIRDGKPNTIELKISFKVT